MVFDWIDYSTDYADLIDGWLDTTAVKMTGIDSGWNTYWDDVIADSVNFPGCKDYCKLLIVGGVPIAVVAFGYFRGDVTISEIVIDPAWRSKGLGTQIIKELIRFSEVWFQEKIDRISAIVFLQNIASQKAFQNAGFTLSLMRDGSAFVCTYIFDVF